MKRSGYRRNVRAYVLVLCLGFAMCLAGCEKKEEGPPKKVIRPVRVMTVGAQQQGAYRNFPGKVQATDTVNLAFRVGGQVVEFPVSEGDSVEQGALIAKLDQKDFVTKVRNIESKLKGARSTQNEAKLNLERSATLLKSDTIARAAYDSAKSSYDNSEANVKSLEQDLAQAKLNVKYTTLTAPFAGVVARKDVKNFQNVQAQQAIIVLENINKIDVVFEVPEFVYVTARNYKGDQKAAVASFAAYPDKTFPLTLKEHETRANPQTQTYTVTMTMPQPKEFEVYPGMTVEVTGFLPMDEGQSLVLVPVQAVFGGEGNDQFVWVLDTKTMKVAKQKVQTGDLTDAEISITSGLEPKDVVVTAGVHYLEEGQEVRILEGKIGG